MHRYWGRKNASVLASIFAEILDKHDVFLDPFCGSGAAPYAALNICDKVFASDINPLALLITEVICEQHDVSLCQSTFLRSFRAVRDSFEGNDLRDLDSIKYFVLSRPVNCLFCNQEVIFGIGHDDITCSCGLTINRKARRVSSKNEKLVGAQLLGGSLAIPGDNRWKWVERIWEKRLSITPEPQCDQDVLYSKLVDNKRVLTKSTDSVSDYFTQFNLTVLRRFKQEIDKSEPSLTRHCLNLLLSAAAPQASRLIPFRNNLTTGGPAWSVPGYWIPPIRIEADPFDVLIRRMKRLESSLNALNQHASSKKSTVLLKQTPAQNYKRIDFGNCRPSVVFLDPPFGQDVPYLEFSALYNAFIGKKASLKDEVVVSNREQDVCTETQFRERLFAALSAVITAAEESVLLILAFNTKTIEPWINIIGALHELGFGCSFVSFAHPAMRSSKAQFSPSNSVYGEFYVGFRRMSRIPAPISVLQAALMDLNKYRFGPHPNYRLVNIGVLHALRNNFGIEDWCKIPSLLKDCQQESQSSQQGITDDARFTNYLRSLYSELDSKNIDHVKKIMNLDKGTAFVEPSEIEQFVKHENWLRLW